MQGTEVRVGSDVLTVKDDLVLVTKTGSSLPENIVGAKGAKASVVADDASFVSDHNFDASDLGGLPNERPGGNQPSDGTPVTISNDGNRLFSGRLHYERSLIKTGGNPGRDGDEHTYTMIGSGSELWTDLEGVNLNELDLGTALWNVAAVETNWAETVDDGHAGSFAPAVYGLSDNMRAFNVEDLRYHVYYLPIVKAIIEGYAKYTLSSTFFDTDFFKRCAHTYGEGDALQITNNNVITPGNEVFGEIIQPQTVSDGEVITFDNSMDGGTFRFNNATGTFTPFFEGTYDIVIEMQYVSGIDFIEFMIGNVVAFSFSPTTPGNYSLFFTVDLASNAEVSVRFQTLNGQDVQVISYNISIGSQSATTPWDQTIEVASCLPAKGVKEFLRGISHQFNLEWGVDSVRRIVTVEPRFPYVIDGQQYPGFYDLTGLRPPPGETLEKAPVVTTVPGYRGQIEFGYNSTKSGLAKYFDENVIDREGVPFNAVRYQTVEERVGSKSTSYNPYFQALGSSGPEYVGSAFELPHLWTGGDRVVPAFNSPFPNFDYSDPTYSHPPSCGLVRAAGASIFWNGETVRRSVPLLSQGLAEESPNNTPAIVLSYSDQAKSFDSFPGLGTTFYRHLASTLLRGRQVTTQNAIPNANEVYTENFRTAVALRYTGGSAYPSILTGIDKYRPGGTATLKYITFIAANVKDFALVRHYNYDQIQLNDQMCDYLFDDQIAHTDGIQNKPLQSIVLTNGVDLPINYPYSTLQSSEATRLQEDIENTLDLLGVDYASVVCSITDDGTYKRWRIEINATRLALRIAQVTSGGTLAGRDFTQSNCA